jgi:hypothetical protein
MFKGYKESNVSDCSSLFGYESWYCSSPGIERDYHKLDPPYPPPLKDRPQSSERRCGFPDLGDLVVDESEKAL